ncbi:MAG TPA: TolC family protein [Candidatus Acidoferrales bacterium]|nr:TolC family protein [Candidatus Acidoferrales bacterium]
MKPCAANPLVRVEGRIAGPFVKEVGQLWSELHASEGSRTITVELKDVTHGNEAGKEFFRRMAARFSSIMLAAILLGGFSASAQQKPALKLNLHDAVEMALKQNPNVQIAALSLAESQKDSAIAFSALLPQADFNVSDRAIRSNIRAGLGLAIPGLPEHAGPFQVFQTGSTFSSPILDLSLWRRWQASRKNITSTDEQRVSVREQIVLLVVSQYLSSLRANAEVQAGQSRVNLAQALYDQSADLEKHGAATHVDTLRANVELQNEKQRLLEAQTNEKIAVYGLSKLLSLDPQQEIELDDAANFSKTTDEGMGTDLAAAYKARPELKALLAEQQSLQYQRSATRDSRLPALRFDGTYEQQGLSSSTVIPTYVYQASVNLPLFTGGRIRAELARDKLELQKNAQRIADERNQIALEVQSATAQEEAAKNEVEVANLGVELAQQEVQQARDRFQAGVANNIEVVNAQDALARANDNQISALYLYSQAHADLARATGQIELVYTK